MKKILIALILCLPMTFIGQVSSKTNGNSARVTKTIPATYAEILITTYSPKEQKIKINFGSQDERSAKRSKAAQIDFFSLIDAMNAMSHEGYKLIDSYTVVGEKVTEQHFIMIKENAFPPKSSQANSIRPSDKKK